MTHPDTLAARPPSKPVAMMRTALVGLSALSGAVALDAHSADVTFRWDYAQSGAAGFALYCGASSRGYSTRIDVGNTDTSTLDLSKGAVSFCSVRAYDPAGEESTFSNEIAVSVPENADAATVLPPITVDPQTGVVPTATGFRVRFAGPVDATRFSLYGSEPGGEGPADVTLVGATSGPVRGSIVLDQDNQGFTFIKTGGVLVPDAYTLVIVSRWDSLVDAFGRPVDGDGDGMFGDDYRFAFTVTPTDGPVLSIGEFARGPGQLINLPATDPAAGIPVRITSAAAVREVAFTLRYNPALLTVQDARLATTVSGVLMLKSIDPVAGLVRIRVANLSGLTSASTILLRLDAEVPVDAAYGSRHVLDLDELEFKDVKGGDLAGLDDDGLHAVVKLGDATGKRVYSSLDAQRVQRVALQLDSGFSAHPLLDPVIVGDVNGSGRLEAADATLIQNKGLRRVVPEIPD